MPSGRFKNFFKNLFTVPALPDVFDAVSQDRSVGEPKGDRYENATADYMDDYERNLKKLSGRDHENSIKIGLENIAKFEAELAGYQAAIEAHSKAFNAWMNDQGPKPSELQASPTPPSGEVSQNFVERRKTILNDLLGDALFYEREILNRTR